MTLDRQQAFTGTRDADIAAERLLEYLSGTVPDFRGPLSIARFKGGQSNPTYLLTAASGRYVMRRKPDGALLASAHAVDREFRIAGVLHPLGFPVPRPLHLCTDETVIGTMFYVMEHVPGRVFWEPHAPGISGAERRALFADLNATMARLHLTPLDGLEDFGRPEGYVARQVKRWSAQYRASATRAVPAMDRLMDWLPSAVPQRGDTAVVHGDFRLDNCIIRPDRPEIAAVLDWELATLGDPVADFSYHLMMWHMPVARGGGGVGTLKGHGRDPGIPAIEDYIADYCAATGRAGLPELDMYLAFNFFRIAAILQGIAGRLRDGTAANANAAAMADEVEPLADTAWAFALKAGA